MLKHHLPSIEALTSNDDHWLTEELKLSTVCADVAVARAFLDEIERLVDRRMIEEVEKAAPRIVREPAANDANAPTP